MPIYMKIEGVSGSVTTRPYTGWIELESCQIGVHRRIQDATGVGSSREASAPSVTEIVVTKYVDNSSTALFKLSLGGDGKKVIIAFVQAPTDVEPYMRIELENTLISSYSTSRPAGSDLPMESLSLNFIKMTYITKDPKLPGVGRGK